MKVGDSMTAWCGVLVASLTAAACSRTTLGPLSDELSWCWPNCTQTWGDFAATLDVPDCPSSNPVLTVNTTADELDGGATVNDPTAAGSTLSLFEALWIAANRGTPHNIFFDPEVFPAGNPATIHLSGNFSAPYLDGVCLDGRHRGVVVEWATGDLACCIGVSCSWCGFNLNQSSMIGITLLDPPYRITTTQSRIAGCRLGTNGVDLRSTPDWYLFDASSGDRLGPGNVLAAGSFSAVRVNAGDAEIFGNFFNYDPLTRTVVSDTLDDGVGVTSNASVHIYDNVFASFSTGVFVYGSATIYHNLVGIEPDGARMSTGVRRNTFARVAVGGQMTVGPDNVITGVDRGVDASAGAFVTRNSIFRNVVGIVSPFSPSPPTIVTATRTGVSGTCTAAGTVEVFSDAANQGETFLGDALCDAGTLQWMLSGVTVPHERNVTATLTDEGLRTSTFSAPVAVP